jgi:hypothetical protein
MRFVSTNPVFAGSIALQLVGFHRPVLGKLGGLDMVCISSFGRAEEHDENVGLVLSLSILNKHWLNKVRGDTTHR